MTPTYAVSAGVEEDKSVPTTAVSMLVAIGMDMSALIVTAAVVVANRHLAGCYINNYLWVPL